MPPAASADRGDAPLARVIVLGGPSGSGKTRLATRLGLPIVPLDEFYKDGDDPTMPRFGEHLDWESAQSWNHDAAMRALREVCYTGAADIPVYSYGLNRATGSHRITLADDGSAAPPRFVVTEGIFAAEVISPLRAEGLLADAIVIANRRTTTFRRRLVRDLSDRRKPVRDIIRIGVQKVRTEATIRRELETAGCVPMSSRAAEHRLRVLTAAEI